MVLFAAALAVRLVRLVDAPPLTDEIDSIRLANDVFLGRALPLTDQPSTYYGPMHVYLLAAFFHVAGRSFTSARLLAALQGAAVPVAAYWLARAALVRPADWWAAWLAAALALPSASLVAIDSHIFWPTSFAPLWLTLALAAYLRGWLTAAGVFFGLTVQSAPQLVAALPAVALHYLLGPRGGTWPARDGLRTRLIAALPAAGAFLLVLTPLALHNALTGGASLRDAETYTQGYAYGLAASAGEYAWNLRNLLSLLVRVAGSNLVLRLASWEYVEVAAMAALLVLAAWRDRRHPARSVLVWMLASTALLMPLYNRGYYSGFPIQNRYLAPLLPAAYCLIACYGAEVVAPATQRLAGRVAASVGGAAGRCVTLAPYALFAALAILPLFSAARYYAEVERNGLATTAALAPLARLDAARSGGGSVTLDAAWQDVKVGPGADLLRAAEVWLELQDRPYVVARGSP